LIDWLIKGREREGKGIEREGGEEGEKGREGKRERKGKEGRKGYPPF